MAAPHVSGAAALLKERFPYLPMHGIQSVLLTTADDQGTCGVDPTFGWGFLNLRRVLNGPRQLLTDVRVDMDASPGGWSAEDPWTNNIGDPGRYDSRYNIGSLIKAGTGKLILAGDSHIGGVTVVEGGTLAMNKRLESAQGVLVESAGTLRGTGVIASPTTVAGTLAPGNSPGTLSFTAPLTLAAGSTTRLDIDGTGDGQGAGNYSRIVAQGEPVQLGGGVAPRLRGIEGDASNTYTPALGERFAVQQSEGGFTGGFSRLEQPEGLDAGTRMDLLFADNAATLQVNPDTLPGQTTAPGNQRGGAALLNMLRDAPLALQPGTFNTWLGKTLASPSASAPDAATASLYARAGGQIHADAHALIWNQHARLGELLSERASGWRTPGAQTGAPAAGGARSPGHVPDRGLWFRALHN